MKTLKKLVSISPLLGALLIFLGMLKLIVYYSFFGIHIVQYIQLSEVVTSFLEDLNIFLIFFIAFFIHSFMGFTLIESSSKGKKNETIEFTMLRVYSKITRSSFFFIFSIALVVLFYILFFNYHGIIWVYLTTIFIFNPVFYLLRKFFDSYSFENIWSQIFLIILFSIVLTINLALYDVFKTKEDKQKVEIEFKDGNYILNPNERMVGKSNEYLFVTNIEDKSLRIIHCTEVKSIKISK